MSYVIEYSPEAETHLRWLTARQQKIVVDSVDRQLINQPNVETRNRKPMRPNPVAPWEHLRVYYEIKEPPDLRAIVLAVGVKERNKVRIGREIVEI